MPCGAFFGHDRPKSTKTCPYELFNKQALTNLEAMGETHPELAIEFIAEGWLFWRAEAARLQDQIKDLKTAKAEAG